MLTYRTIKESVAKALKDAIAHGVFQDISDVHLIQPPSGEMGDISFACFEVAEAIKKNPAEIAQEFAKAIAQNMPTGQAGEIIKEVRSIGPYVNFFIKDEALFESVVERAVEAGGKAGESDIGNGETIVLEYLSPNTNKPLHIGHVRNACLGDSMARILESQGWKVERVQIINDQIGRAH